MSQRKSVGTIGLPGQSHYPVGVGYVVIPFGIEREAFIATCYQTNTLCIRTEGGDFFKNVPIADKLMTDIVFPKEKSSSEGSVVVFAMIPKHNAPVVFSVLGLKDELGSLIEEGQFKLAKSTGDDSFGLEVRTKNGSMTSFSASGRNSTITFRLVSDDESSKFELQTKGEVDIYGSKKVRIQSADEVRLELVDEKIKPIAHIRYNKNTQIWEIFGSSNSDGQWALLGEDWIEKAEEICDILSDLCQNVSQLQVSVLAPQSPSGPPINASVFLSVKTKVAALKQQLKTTLSKKVKID